MRLFNYSDALPARKHRGRLPETKWFSNDLQAEDRARHDAEKARVPPRPRLSRTTRHGAVEVTDVATPHYPRYTSTTGRLEGWLPTPEARGDDAAHPPASRASRWPASGGARRRHALLYPPYRVEILCRRDRRPSARPREWRLLDHHLNRA